MNIADLSINRPIMMSMLLLVFVLFGAIAYFDMNLEYTPEVSLPIVTVQTVYPGAGPQEIETQVTKRIEDAVSPVSGIDYMQSYTMENVSYLVISFKLDKDINIALQEVKDKVSGIVNDLPDDAQLPVTKIFDPTSLPVVEIVLSGAVESTKLYDIADKQLSTQLAQIQGVANIEITGGAEREIRIEVDNSKAAQYGISLQQLAQILSAQNIDLPGGNMQRNSQEFSVRLKGQFRDAAEIGDMQIQTASGLMRLGDIATVSDIGEERRESTTYRNLQTGAGDDDVVLLRVMKASGGNAVSIYEEIEQRMPQLQASLPEGCTMSVVHENSSLTKASVDDTFSDIIMGVVLTSLILLFFLHDYKSTVIVALSMPISIVSTFVFMQWADFSFNVMSLMGLSTAVGILVTNSVVVLENIFRHKDMGHSNRVSAANGTNEIAIAVIASTLTNLVVFLPLATMNSIAGRFFQQFSLTVVFATIVSLVTSFTLTPMLASLFLPSQDKKKHPIGARLEKMFKGWDAQYGRMLRWLLHNKRRGWGVIVGSIVFFLATMFLAGALGFEFMPKIDERMVGVRVELPISADLNTTSLAMNSIEERLKKYPEIKHTWTTIGTLGSTDRGVNLAYLKIQLVDEDKGTKTTDEVVQELTRDLSDVPNARIRVGTLSLMNMSEGDIEFDLTGSDLAELEQIKNRLMPKFQDIKGLINLNSSSRAGKPEIIVTPRRDVIANAGLTLSEIALAVRGSIDGLVFTTLKDRGEEYDIRVVASDESVDTPEEIGQIPITSRTGSYTIEQVADVSFSEGYSKILRKDRSREIKFAADIAPGFAMGDLMKEIERIVEEAELPAGYGIQWGARAREMNNTTAAIGFAFIIAVILTYMLLAAILESFTQPLYILGTIPLGMIGVVLAMLATGLTMNIISMLSIVMLIGIVVNNAILLLDYTNQLVREKGYSVYEALLEACPTKLKPIIMSTLAIILGMLPMAMGLGSAGSEFRQPMGVVSIGGLVASTILALVIIPVLYNLGSKTNRASSTTGQAAS